MGQLTCWGHTPSGAPHQGRGASAPQGARGCVYMRLRRVARPAPTNPHFPMDPQLQYGAPAERHEANTPGMTARGPNFARTRSATSSIRRAFSSTGSKVS